MSGKPRLGELLLGTEGLALLRTAFSDDLSARRARVDEVRALLADSQDSDLWSAPLDSQEYDLNDGYDLWSETYDRPLRLFPVEEPVMHGLIDTLPTSTVLDAACGTGRYSNYLAAHGHRVIGVDRSPAMLARACSKLHQGDFHDGDLEALPLDDGSVDAVVCALAMVHLAGLERAASELARVVRPGGRVIVSDVHPFLIQLGWQAQFRTAGDEAGFMRLNQHMLSDYCRAFIAAGLAIRGCHEPCLTADSAVTPAAERLPEANRAAWAGLPGVVIWDLQKG